MANQKLIDLKPLQDQVDLINAMLKKPLPTPPVGTPVVWYQRADNREGNERAAIVTMVDGPGKVSLTVFAPQSMPKPVRQCLHVSDPIHENRSNSVSVNLGSWGYPDGAKCPDRHLNLHRESLKTRLEACKQGLQDAIDANKRVKELEAAEAAAQTANA